MVPQAALVKSSESKDAKALLRANTEEAVALGAYGVPTMVVSGSGLLQEPSLFFGSDRFEQLAFLAEKPWFGPDPATLKSNM